LGFLDPAVDFINAHQRFVITAHETPDGDAIGSECALYHALRQLGKEAYVLNADPIPEKYTFLDPEGAVVTLETPDRFSKNLSEFVLVILDTNDINNIGQVRDWVLPHTESYFIIDHHDQQNVLEKGNCIIEEASSTCEILYELFQELHVDVHLGIAQPLYVGIVYDTGSFIYPKTSAKTFKIAYNLVKAGVSPNFVYQKIYESNSISSLVLQSKVLSTLELVYDQQVAIQTMLKETVLECRAAYEEADTFINIPLKSEQIVVSIFFKQNLESILRCSIRSKGDINVAEIAQYFGGGGHKTAAGFKCKETLENTRNQVLKMLEKYFT
jgi:bifunctional oligoribonuclease and PAP phosphatase NrnA